MNIVLWVLQVLLGLAFMGVAYTHGLQPEQLAVQPGGAWISALPDGLRIFIALAEFLGGLGLILPAATKIQPRLTPLAAVGLALIMVLAIGFHLTRGEYPNIVFNFVLLVIAAIIAYGRFMMAPLKARD
jgi:hypothetical protein